MAVLAQTRRVGSTQGHGLQAKAVKAIDQPQVPGEGNPFQPPHGQQVGHRDDAHPCAAGVAGSQIAYLYDG
ncbi:hypothetical protein D3C76_669850 [compost metagenome]